MDPIRKDLLEHIKTLNPYHLAFGDVGSLHDYTKYAEARLLILACDYPLWKHFLPLCVRALQQKIQVIFFKSGVDLAQACRTTKDKVAFVAVLSTYRDPFVRLCDEIRGMTVDELIQRNWKPDLYTKFRSIHRRYE